MEKGLQKLDTQGFEAAGEGERHHSSSWELVSLLPTTFQEMPCDIQCALH